MMKCPACRHDLVEYSTGQFNVEICRDGCSGIWFDKGELEKCDEHTEAFPDELLRVRKIAAVVIDRTRARTCPKCTSATLKRVELDPETNFEIDSCPSCHGGWLDIGELEALRKRAKKEAELNARLVSYENKLAAQIKEVDGLRRFGALIRVLFK